MSKKKGLPILVSGGSKFAFGHRRSAWREHAELTDFVGGSADDRAVPAPGDNDGLSPQLRVVALLHERVERVHVDMHNLACSHAKTILFLNPGRVRIELVSACGSVGA